MKSTISLILGTLTILLVSGCTSTPSSKYTLNDFVSAISVDLDGVQPQIVGPFDMKSLSWNISNSYLQSAGITDLEGTNKAEKMKQDIIDTYSKWGSESEIKYYGPTTKTISLEQITVFEMDTTKLEGGKVITKYIWSKDNFLFLLMESKSAPKSHIDELANRIISVYNK